MPRRAVIAAAFALFALCSAAACSPGGGSTAAEDPVAELKSAGQSTAALKSVAADVKFGPGVVYQGLTLDSATTRLAQPDGSDTTLKVRQNDFLVDVRVVTIGGHVYVKVPFGKFTEVTATDASQLPDLGALLNRDHGLPAILPAGTATRRVGTEKVGDVQADKITTTYTADQVAKALGGLKPAGDVAATLWISPGDHYVRKVVLSGPLIDAGKTTTVEVLLHDFNVPVSIVQPTP